MRTRTLTHAALAVSMLAGLAATTPSAGAAPEPGAAVAASRARVCLVIDPSYSEVGVRLGHVGWMVQDTARNRWVGGATEIGGLGAQPGANPDRAASGSWSERGTYRAIIDTFKAKRGGYEKMRCRYSRHGDADQAVKVFNRSTYRAYYLLTDNCLTRSVAAFKAYSSEFRSLPDGKRTRPNAYYDATLRGWTTVRL